jgi:hypothetical protein
LPQNIVRDIRSREVELAGLELPQGVDARTVGAIRQAISESFVSGFRVVLLCCAALSMGSGFLAWQLIPAAAISRVAPPLTNPRDARGTP